MIVTDNLFGDIITDLAAAITGGIGLARQRQRQPRPHRALACSSPCTARRPTSPASRRPTRPRRSCPRPCCSTTSGYDDAAPRRRGRRRRRPRRARRPAPPSYLRGRRRDRRARSRLTAASSRSPGTGTPPACTRRACSTASPDRPSPDPRGRYRASHADQRPATPADAGQRRPARGDPREPRVRPALHRPHVHGRVDARRRAGTTPGSTPYGPLTLDPATAVLHYAQEIFEGMKAYRHEDGSVWTFRPEENAARMVRSAQRLALPELPVEDFVAVGRRAGAGRRALGARRRRGRRASTSGRSCSPPRRSSGCGPSQHVTFMVIASPGRRLLPRAAQAGHALAQRGLHPRRPRRHGRGQDRRQLRQLAGRPAGGHRPGLRPGGLPRRPGGQVRRGARRHEPVLRLRRRHDRHPRRPARSSRASPAARSSSCAGKLGHQVEERQVLHRRVARGRRRPAGSPRSSPAAPRPS